MKAFQILLFTCILVLFGVPFASAAEADYLTYDKFIAEVESGYVKSASLDRFSQITGTYTVDGAERAFKSYGDVGSAHDVLLTRLLKQKGVAVTLKDQKERSGFLDGPGMFSAVLMLLVPLVTLILAFRNNSKLNRLDRNDRNA